MRRKPDSCAGCSIAGHGNDFSAVEGTGANGVLMVGEASGEHEQRDQLPFRPYAPAGSLLERILRRMGMDRQSFSTTNVVRCRPRNNWLEKSPWEYAAINHCRLNLDAVIAERRPRAILALGGIATRELTGEAGPARGVSHLAGYVLPGPSAIPVIPNFHPAFLRRGKASHQGVFARILNRAVNIAAGRDRDFLWHVSPSDPTTHGGLRYAAHPSLDEATGYLRSLESAPHAMVSYDIETFESASLDEDAREGFSDTQLRLIQFCSRPREAIAFPWEGGYREIARRILHLANPKVGHNCFAKNTSVWMRDGKWKSIWAVKPGEYVRTSVGGRLAVAKVSANFKARDDRDWVEVRVDGAYNRGVGRWGNPGVICTPDHEWILANGKRVEASRLSAGDCVELPRLGSMDLIVGSLNGDGYVSPSGVFKVSHTNEAWTKAKAESFGVAAHRYKRTGGYEGSEYYWSVQIPMARTWRARHYTGKQKLFVPGNDRMLAVFYGDDGCMASKKKRNQTARLCLHAFPLDSRAEIVKWFTDEFGYCSIQNKGTLALSVDASRNFFLRISRYLHPSMAYKLPEYCRGFYNGWMGAPEYQLGWVTSITKGHPKQYSQKDKYCLTVEGTHSFFTRAGLVSNCWLFDNKVLRAAGEREGVDLRPRGVIHDTLAMFHHWQPDLPAHLQFAAGFVSFPFPWKHLAGTEIEFYGCCDVDATLRLYTFLEATLKADGLWDDNVKAVA